MEKKNQKPHDRKAPELEPDYDENADPTTQAQGTGQDAGSTNSDGDTTVQRDQEEIMEPVTNEHDNELQEDLDQTRQKAEENLEGWRRERAEFSNYRKRIEREQSQLSGNITGEVIKKYLVILDDLSRALKTRPTEGEGATWSQGIELIYRKLQNILDLEGVVRIPAESGQEFNPEIHEAISHEDSPDYKSGEIIEVVQQGYKIGDRVLRPALVRVAR